MMDLRSAFEEYKHKSCRDATGRMSKTCGKCSIMNPIPFDDQFNSSPHDGAPERSGYVPGSVWLKTKQSRAGLESVTGMHHALVVAHNMSRSRAQGALPALVDGAVVHCVLRAVFAARGARGAVKRLSTGNGRTARKRHAILWPACSEHQDSSVRG
jgi:hypothetical protein